MFQLTDEHTPFLGKLAKLTELGVELEKEYKQLFGIGNIYAAQSLYFHCQSRNKYQLYLMFIDEKPIKVYGLTLFCLKEVGIGACGDWHWFSLEQLMLCSVEGE